MTKKSKAQLKAQVDANIVVNGNREITPPKHNSIETNEIDSFLNIVDGGVVVDALTGYSADLTPTDDKHWTPKKYVDDQIAASTPTGVLLAANNLDDLGNLSTAKTNLGINNVNNTSDANKPVSTAQAAAIALKEPLITAGTTAQYWRGDKSFVSLATDVLAVALTGLSLVTGTAITATDSILVAFGKLQKQITDLIASVGTNTTNIASNTTAIGLRALDSAVVHNTGAEAVAGVKTFSSSPIVPTLSASDNTTKAASTAYVDLMVALLNRAYVALTDAASISIPFFTVGVANYTWSSARTAVTFTFTGDTNASEAYIILTKTTASNLVLTLPAASLITDQNGTEVVGLAVTLTSTASGVFEIYLKKTAAGYRAIIKRNVA